MIYTSSRYATGTLFKAWDARKNQWVTTVLRNYPKDVAVFYTYVWQERDRPENVAARTIGNSEMWWKIMDYNPEIIDPFNIPIGTTIRIPRG
jgi:hypothetical protein